MWYPTKSTGFEIPETQRPGTDAQQPCVLGKLSDPLEGLEALTLQVVYRIHDMVHIEDLA